MNDKKFDHTRLSDTVRHWPSLPEDDRIPQRFRGHFMSHKLDATTVYNFHDSLSGTYRHGGISILATGNLIWRRVQYGRYTSGIGRWSWQQFRGRWDASIHIITFYRPVPPVAGGGPGSVYAQHLNHLSNLKRRECTIIAFLSDLSDDINTWKSKGFQIIIMGYTNENILSKKIRNFAKTLGLR